MSNTSLGFPLFSLTDDADIAAKLNAISNSLNSYLNGQNGSLQHNSGLSFSTASGFGSLDYYWQVRWGWVFLKMTATRTGAAITAPSNGNIGTTLIATLNTTAYQPAVQILARAYCTSTGGSANLQASGTWTLTDLNSSSTINTNDFVAANYIYPVA